MSTLRVPVDLLLEKAKSLQDIADNNCDLYEQIVKHIEAVQSCGDWNGVSVDTLIRTSKANQEKYETAILELKARGLFLKEYTDDMVKTDEELRNQINLV